MNNFILNDLKNTFKNKNNGVIQLIVINVIVFLVANLINALFFRGGDGIEHYLAIPANPLSFLLKPWTIVTYMFLHLGLMHILFNMMWLYWMGQILSQSIGNTKFINVFLVGGLAGGTSFFLVYNLMNLLGLSDSFFSQNSYLLGASAGVMAVVFAAATLHPNMIIRLMFIGNVKLKYLALGSLVLTSLIDIQDNTGGKIAHLGGALYGYLYIKNYRQGKDISIWFQAVYNSIMKLFTKKSNMKVAYKKPIPDEVYNVKNKSNQEQIDAILDKISKSGYESLTKKEKDFLFNMSNKR